MAMHTWFECKIRYEKVMENEKYPLIVYVQGSAWHKQNVYQHVGQLNYLCKQGFVVAIVQYRESDLAPFPAHGNCQPSPLIPHLRNCRPHSPR